MQGNQGILLICLTSHSLIASGSPLLLGTRPSKRKFGDGNNPLKDKHRQKKVKVKSTMPPSTQGIELDAPTSCTTTTPPNPPSSTIPLISSTLSHESLTPTAVPDPTIYVPHTTAILSPASHPPLAPDLGMSTSTQGQQTDACNTVPKQSTPLSPSDHAPCPSTTTPPTCVHNTSPQPAPSPLALSAPLPCVPDYAPVAPAASALLPPSAVHVPIQGRSIELQVNLSH